MTTTSLRAELREHTVSGQLDVTSRPQAGNWDTKEDVRNGGEETGAVQRQHLKRFRSWTSTAIPNESHSEH